MARLTEQCTLFPKVGGTSIVCAVKLRKQCTLFSIDVVSNEVSILWCVCPVRTIEHRMTHTHQGQSFFLFATLGMIMDGIYSKKGSRMTKIEYYYRR